MNRESKAKKVDELKDTFANAKFAVVADYRGLKVNEFEQLRVSLREQGGLIQVAKHTLLKLAVQGTDFEGMTQDFAGPTA
ncbi:MAG: 50S ribosomal protein L10, partial [Candidatus Electrothrix sp. EH2]|nr:50S ribosomal protein L10 [Candidatus Electrothrix sp. EH2]